jgi:hypothetical protein
MPSQRDILLHAAGETPSPPGVRHAVVIGINQYKDDRIRDLHFACADAEALYEKLVDPELGRFSPENAVLLLDEQATGRNIVSAIGTRLRRSAGENDLVCIYYAGHGAIDPDPGAENGLQKYIVPHDGDIDDLFSSGIPMTRVEEFFRRIVARQVLFFLDSCYSGGANGRTFQNPRLNTRSVLTSGFLERLGANGRFVVTSCSPNEVSLESSELGSGHGVFTFYLLQGLAGAADQDGDGLVTMGELFDYLADHVPSHARRLGGSMTPIKTGSTEGRIYLTRYETALEKAAREIEAQARELHDAGSLDEAEAVWRELSALLPGHEAASRALEDIANTRERERRTQEEQDRARAAELRLKQRVLYRLFRSNELTPDVFDEALALLEREPGGLTASESEVRDLVELLADGRITAAAFRTSRELVTQGSDSEAAEAPTAPAEVAPRETGPPLGVERWQGTGEHAVETGAQPEFAQKSPDVASSTIPDSRPTDRPEPDAPHQPSRGRPGSVEPWRRRGLRVVAFSVAAGVSIYLFSLLLLLIT